MLNRRLAEYTTPLREREIITLNVDPAKMRGRRLNLSRILGESVVYEAGQAVQLRVCVVNNEAADQRALRGAPLAFPQRFCKHLRRADGDDGVLQYKRGLEVKEMNPVIRFEQYQFNKLGDDCYCAGVTKVDRRLQQLLSMEPGAQMKKMACDSSSSLLQLAGESGVRLFGENTISYVLRQYDSIVIPKGVKFELKAHGNRTAVIMLVREDRE